MVVRKRRWNGGVGVMVKEELCEKVVVRRVRDRVMSLFLKRMC